MASRIVILTNQTLLLEGVITRLQQYRERVKLYVLNLQQADLLARIIRIRPTAIILDDKDPSVSQALPLEKLLQALPTLKVIRLDNECLQTQVICSEQYSLADVCDLLELIEPTHSGIDRFPGNSHTPVQEGPWKKKP